VKKKNMEVISQFAADTKHKLHLESESDTVLLAKKFLATQAPIVPYNMVYPYVSNDATRIEFRAPKQLQRYAEGIHLKPGLLSALLESNVYVPGVYAIVDDYCAAVRPPAGKELVTFFLHGQREKNLHELIASELGGTELDPMLYTRIRAYKPDEAMIEPEIAREIGFLICGLKFPQIEFREVRVPVPVTPPPPPPSEGEGVEQQEPDSDSKLPTGDAVEYTDAHERELRNNPVMQTFKRESKLSNQYPSIKAAKQIMLSIADKSMDQSHLQPLFGKKQTNAPYVTIAAELDWNAVKSIVNHFDAASIEKIRDTPTVATFEATYKHNCTDARALIKEVLQAHSPFAGKAHERYLKKCQGRLDPQFIKAVVQATN
jgi:hypothetical protein